MPRAGTRLGSHHPPSGGASRRGKPSGSTTTRNRCEEAGALSRSAARCCSSVGLRRVIALPGLRSQRARPTNVLGHVRCNQCVRLRGRRASRVPAHWSSAARRPLSPNQIECARPNVGRDDGLIAPGPALRDSAACCNLLQWSQRPRALERKGDQTAGRVAKPPRRTRLGGPPARHSRPDSAALLPFASCRSDVARTTGRTRSTAGRTTPRR